MKRIYFLVIFFTMVTVTAYTQTTNYSVHALYVFNIAKYSAWPAVNGELKVNVYGKTKAYDHLLKHNGKNVNGHILKISQIENTQDIRDAHIVYLADSKSSVIDEVLAHTQGKSIMIIGEREGLFKKGAGFSFVILENNTLRFDINTTELEKRNIKVSKSLSSLANASL